MAARSGRASGSRSPAGGGESLCALDRASYNGLLLKTLRRVCALARAVPPGCRGFER